MPLFFFDTISDQQHFRDQDGIDLPDCEAARTEAIKAVAEIARDELPTDSGDRRDIIADVRDETGRLVFTAHLSFTARRVD